MFSNLLVLVQLVSAASCSRTNDTGSLKFDALTYMLDDPATQSVKPPIRKGDPKSARGWNHPLTARNLCPIVLLEEYDKDPQYVKSVSPCLLLLTLMQICRLFMNQVLDGTRKITHHKFPVCFYDVTMFDPKNKKKGFLRSQGLVRVRVLVQCACGLI